MEKMNLAEIVAAVDGSFGYPANAEINNISTDTRTISEGSVFVAIKGEKTDGHLYARKAMELGAEAVITDHIVDGAKCIVVDSTRKALLELASYYRSKFDIPVVGITGSVGKTTTKDMIACVLSEKFNTMKTQGNHNNDIGVPWTLFTLSDENTAAVVEMGMSHAGEISKLSLCARPTMAVITNIGVSHIENLESQENILKAKLEILDGADYDAPLIVSQDDKYLRTIDLHGTRKVIYYSTKKKDCDVYATDIKESMNRLEFKIHSSYGVIDAELNCMGIHNVQNALAAFCVGSELGMEPEEIAAGLKKFRPDGIRQNIHESNGKVFIVDCYNASPDSMKSSLDVLSKVEIKGEGKRYAVLGGMLELGDKARKLHKNVGEYAAGKCDYILCFGENSELYKEAAVKKGFDENNCHCFESREALADYLKANLKENDAVLFKGSRGMKLEEVVNALE